MTRCALFIGPNGLRAGWSLALAFLAFSVVASGASAILSRALGTPESPPWTAPLILGGEVFSFFLALGVIAVMRRIEGRPWSRYGLGLSRSGIAAVGRGTLWGGAAIGLLVLAISLLGGYRVHGLALAGGDLVVYTLLWALAFLFVGLYEEVWFRGYTLFTLGRGIRFWPAALVLSVIFGFVLHFLQKPDETVADGLSVTLIALFFCLTVRRTGAVWYAVGWHFAFNFGSMFVFGAPNTGNHGNPVAKHLLEGAFSGPDWLTGGARGPEASWLVFPVMALTALLFHLTHRRTAFFPERPDQESGRLGQTAMTAGSVTVPLK
jgi:membrane protease YdiL (CAAX protease family)